MIKLIPKNKQGTGLLVFCNKCKTRQSLDNHCTHKENWVYKTDFHKDNRRVTKVLKSKKLDDAILELHLIKKANNNFKKVIKLNNSPTILYGIEKYIQKVNCKNEFSVNKSRTKDHCTERLRVIQRFGECLDNMGIIASKFPINDLSFEVLDPFYELLKTKYKLKSETSIDKHTRIMRNFLTFLTGLGVYTKANFFKTIETSPIVNNITTVTDEELSLLLKNITKENGKNKSKKNHYSSWLKDALIIGRHTGIRREELYELKWSDIAIYEGVNFLFIKDLKPTRQKQRIYSKVIPITKQLSDYLALLKVNSNSEKMIDCNLNSKTFCDNLSRAFTHFFKFTHPNQEVKHFKHLRKTQITELAAILGEDAYLASGHSGNKVLEKHYINRIEAAIKFSNTKDSFTNSPY